MTKCNKEEPEDVKTMEIEWNTGTILHKRKLGQKCSGTSKTKNKMMDEWDKDNVKKDDVKNYDVKKENMWEWEQTDNMI